MTVAICATVLVGVNLPLILAYIVEEHVKSIKLVTMLWVNIYDLCLSLGWVWALILAYILVWVGSGLISVRVQGKLGTTHIMWTHIGVGFGLGFGLRFG